MRLRFVVDKNYDKHFVTDKKVLRYVDGQYRKESRKFLELTKKLYQQSWDEIGDDFSDYVEETTGHKWFYDTYECVVSVIHKGISNWSYGPKIARSWQENPFYMRRVTAHELILSHYFEIHKRHYKNARLTDGQIWVLAEIAAFALISLTPDVKKFWPWDTEYCTGHNYPHILELQKKLKTIFLSRKSFDEYVDKGIVLVKKYPKIGPCGW